MGDNIEARKYITEHANFNRDDEFVANTENK